jgi:mono/diheme cytochrome c family protein
VNRQIGYITSAHLLLIGVALGGFFISKIPFNSPAQNQQVLYDNVRPKKETILSGRAAIGKTLFMSKCASCHALFKDMTGPGLSGAIAGERWADRSQLYKWIRNPEAFMKTNAYARELKERYGSIMPAFPNLTDEDIEAIVEYINESTSVAAS